MSMEHATLFSMTFKALFGDMAIEKSSVLELESIR